VSVIRNVLLAGTSEVALHLALDGVLPGKEG